jgi:hypothetical protein
MGDNNKGGIDIRFSKFYDKLYNKFNNKFNNIHADAYINSAIRNKNHNFALIISDSDVNSSYDNLQNPKYYLIFLGKHKDKYAIDKDLLDINNDLKNNMMVFEYDNFLIKYDTSPNANNAKSYEMIYYDVTNDNDVKKYYIVDFLDLGNENYGFNYGITEDNYKKTLPELKDELKEINFLFVEQQNDKNKISQLEQIRNETTENYEGVFKKRHNNKRVVNKNKKTWHIDSDNINLVDNTDNTETRNPDDTINFVGVTKPRKSIRNRILDSLSYLTQKNPSKSYRIQPIPEKGGRRRRRRTRKNTNKNKKRRRS